MKFLVLAFFILAGCEKIKQPEIKPIMPSDVIKELDKESLNNAWKKEESVIVIDAYQENGIDWNKMATDKKMVAVIHRSAQGLKKDIKYDERKKIALQRGYLWGAYHLGSRGNTIAQADLFISQTHDKDTLMMLDLEDTSNASMMSIEESIIFMNYVYEKTGKIPVIYANHSVTLKLNDKLKSNALFKKSKLWYARFKSNVSDFPVGIWSNYFLWQFSSEINCSKTGSCLYNVPGTSSDMDINVFYGSKEELKSQWRN